MPAYCSLSLSRQYDTRLWLEGVFFRAHLPCRRHARPTVAGSLLGCLSPVILSASRRSFAATRCCRAPFAGEVARLGSDGACHLVGWSVSHGASPDHGCTALKISSGKSLQDHATAAKKLHVCALGEVRRCFATRVIETCLLSDGTVSCHGIATVLCKRYICFGCFW